MTRGSNFLLQGETMRRILPIAGAVFALSMHTGLIGQEKSSALAVINFENRSIFDATAYEALSTGLPRLMYLHLKPVRELNVVDRTALARILDSLKLEQAGLVTGNAARQVGTLTGADRLLMGSFMVLPDGRIRIDVRLVESMTGKAQLAEEVTGKTDDIRRLMHKLMEKVFETLPISPEIRKQVLKNKPSNVSFEAMRWYASGEVFLDRGDRQKALQCFQKCLDLAPDFTEASVRLRSLTGNQ